MAIRKYDVVIVGSGAGGSMMAYMLTRAGASVAVVEAGGHNIDRDIRHHQWPWELPSRDRNHVPDPVHFKAVTRHETSKGVVEQVSIFDGTNGTYYDDHFYVKIRDWRYTCAEGLPFFWTRVRALGGKTNCWLASVLRWGPLEWKSYSYDGVGIDWPISYEEMEPWYSRTEQLIGVSGERCGRRSATPDGEFMPPPGLSCPQQVLKSTARGMGYVAVTQPRAIITQPHRGRTPCHYCGRCNQGCDPGSKFTAVGSLLPLAAATGRMTVISNAIVREVTLDHQGRASGVHYIDRYTFRENAVTARYVVLSASAIETARILLNSKSNLFPNGLANSSGQVGRNLVEDCTAAVSGHLPQMEGREVVNEDGDLRAVLVHPFVNVDEKTRSKSFLRRYQMLLRGGFSMGVSEGAGFGELLKQDVRRLYGASVTVGCAGCGLEDPNNFVELDPEVKDAWGIPVVRVHSRFGPNHEAMARDVAVRGSELIEAAGGKVDGWSASSSIPGDQIHEQGTCRMGDDPKTFVTNRWGQCHDVPNLILADGSIHCTSGITNPTLTILALTMRNATHFADEVRKGNA